MNDQQQDHGQNVGDDRKGQSKKSTATIIGILLGIAVVLLVVNAVVKDKPVDNNGNQNVAVVNVNRLQNSNTNQPEPDFSEVNLDVSTWKTYKNEELGFEMKYPNELNAQVNPPNFLVPTYVFKNSNKEYESQERAYEFYVSGKMTNNTQPEQYFSSDVLDRGLRNTVNGIKTVDFPGEGGAGRTVYFFGGNSIVIFTQSEIPTSQFEQVLESFKFVSI